MSFIIPNKIVLRNNFYKRIRDVVTLRTKVPGPLQLLCAYKIKPMLQRSPNFEGKQGLGSPKFQKYDYVPACIVLDMQETIREGIMNVM